MAVVASTDELQNCMLAQVQEATQCQGQAATERGHDDKAAVIATSLWECDGNYLDVSAKLPAETPPDKATPRGTRQQETDTLTSAPAENPFHGEARTCGVQQMQLNTPANPQVECSEGGGEANSSHMGESKPAPRSASKRTLGPRSSSRVSFTDAEPALFGASDSTLEMASRPRNEDDEGEYMDRGLFGSLEEFDIDLEDLMDFLTTIHDNIARAARDCGCLRAT
eukprot:NODE_2837_length_867_cov_328.995074.p1 GENE.NODE_2837_length_867_cov_328.995074~~NODE_2837_length_867_cov_328.995074.p1  ORF type:complete len:225 (+),score=34.06 NODE_2837_length_867_cov_328.995074:106-780(+)